jgi:hypothetical protein
MPESGDLGFDSYWMTGCRSGVWSWQKDMRAEKLDNYQTALAILVLFCGEQFVTCRILRHAIAT